MNIKDFKNNNDWKSGSWIPYTVAACAAVILYTILNNVPSILGGIGSALRLMNPLFIGIVISYILSPLIRLFDGMLKNLVKRDKLRNNIAVILAAVVLLVFVVILLYALVPQIVDSIVTFVNNLNVYSNAVSETIQAIANIANKHNIGTERMTEIMNQMIDNIVAFITRNARGMLNRSFSYGGVLVNVGIGFIMALYFVVSKKAIFQGLDKLCRYTMKPEKYQPMKVFLLECNRIVMNFVIGDLVDAIIVGVINFIFMSILNMPYAVIISVVVGVTNLAPTFGPFAGATIGAFILLFADPGATVKFLLFTLILQLLDGYVIKPKLFGESMGVPGVWITVGIIVGGKFFGVIGILLAVPLVGIITFIYRGFIAAKEKEYYAQNGNSPDTVQTDLPVSDSEK